MHSHPFPACVPDSLQVFLTRKLHAGLRTLAFARTVTAGLNKTSFHPFIFNRKSQNGLEVFANTFFRQVISYCAVLRLPPIRKSWWRSYLLLFICCAFVPHLREQVHVPVRSEVLRKTWPHWQSPELIHFFPLCFILDLSGTKTETDRPLDLYFWGCSICVLPHCISFNQFCLQNLFTLLKKPSKNSQDSSKKKNLQVFSNCW